MSAHVHDHIDEYLDCFETAAKSELREKSYRDYRSLQTGKVKPKRTMSASARRKIAAAQRARWAKVKAQQKTALGPAEPAANT
jgi:hypothetical protein